VADLLGPGGVYTLNDGDREIRLRLLDPADAAVTGALVGEALHSGGAEATFSTVTALPSRGHEIELSVDVDPGDMDFVEHVSATPTRRAASAADGSPWVLRRLQVLERAWDLWMENFGGRRLRGGIRLSRNSTLFGW